MPKKYLLLFTVFLFIAVGILIFFKIKSYLAIGVTDSEIQQNIQPTDSVNPSEQKAVSYGYVIKHFDDSLGAIDTEIERLKALKDTAEGNKEYLKQRLSSAMQEFGYEKITTPTLTLSFRKSESVEITDEKYSRDPVPSVVVSPER